jgi:hypothetical protein
MTGAEQWFLSAAERANAWTRLDRDHPGQVAWTTGNEVTPLIHGRSYLPELLRCIQLMRRDDLLLFTDWRGDPDSSWTARTARSGPCFVERPSAGCG